jgi:small subunit ribosomal protein S20
MPNIQSAIKRLKQSLIRRKRNRSTKKSIRTECKKVIEAVKSGNVDNAEKELSTAAKLLDKSAAKKVIHHNAASRLKSRLSARVKKLKGK